MTQTQTSAPAAPPKPAEPIKPVEPPKPAEPPTLEDLLKRIEALEIHAGLAPKPPRKDTITAYYKTPPFKPEPEPKDEKPEEKAAREARDKSAKERAGKTVIYELPPVVYEEAKNGRLVRTEQPSPVPDENGHQRMVAARWIVPEDADAWSLEDPDAKDRKADETYPTAMPGKAR
jgi:hypothetical protein